MTPPPADADSGATVAQQNFKARVLDLVGRIPSGRVMTYGQLALLAGTPGAARQVGFILSGLASPQGAGRDLPWQRVINARGGVSTDKLGFGEVQRSLLEREGVAFGPDGRCELERWQWWPEGESQEPESQPGLF